MPTKRGSEGLSVNVVNVQVHVVVAVNEDDDVDVDRSSRRPWGLGSPRCVARFPSTPPVWGSLSAAKRGATALGGREVLRDREEQDEKNEEGDEPAAAAPPTPNACVAPQRARACECGACGEAGAGP